MISRNLIKNHDQSLNRYAGETVRTYERKLSPRVLPICHGVTHKGGGVGNYIELRCGNVILEDDGASTEELLRNMKLQRVD